MPRRRGPHLTREPGKLMYLGMGAGRSFRLVQQHAVAMGLPQPSLSTIGRWSKADGWVEEAKRYDQRVADAGMQAILIDQAIADKVRLVRFARDFQNVAQLGLDALKKTPDELSGSEVARLGQVGFAMEQTITGEAWTLRRAMGALWNTITNSIGPLYQEAQTAGLDLLATEVEITAELRVRVVRVMDGLFASGYDDQQAQWFHALQSLPDEADEDEASEA